MDPIIIEILKTAKIPVENHVKPGDDVLIVADTATEPLIWEVMAAAVHERGACPTVTIMPELPFHHARPPKPVAEAMKHANVAILVPSKGFFHSPAVMEAAEYGTSFMACEQLTVSMLRGAAAKADYKEIQAIGEKLKKKIEGGKVMRITSKAGTDITASIEGRIPFAAAATPIRLQAGGPITTAFPNGETSISPVEGTAEGTVVWDGSMHQIGVIKEPIRATFHKGRMVDVKGGVEAAQLKDYLEKYGDENAWLLCEFAIGTNPGAGITGLVREDKKMLGASHIALGMNTDTGGKIDSKIHLDGVVKKVTVYVDGIPIVQDGVVLP